MTAAEDVKACPTTIAEALGVKGSDGLVHEMDKEDTYLMEIVSASGLSTRVAGGRVDAYCVVMDGHDKIHRTDIIHNDADPIWTVKSGSICSVSLKAKDSTTGEVVRIVVYSGSKTLGIVKLYEEDIVECNNERKDFCAKLPDDSTCAGDENHASVALRFRRPTETDRMFLNGETVHPYGPVKSPVAENQKSWLPQIKTYYDRDREEWLYRTEPYPHPSSQDSSKWLASDEIHSLAETPSEKWIEAGHGELGNLYVEILGCDNLPNLDTGILGDLTDTYCGVVFEDNMLKTDVINNRLNPRWMPWCKRAFCFHIRHATSILMIGVLDYNTKVIETGNDKLGRVVVNTVNMRPGTSYLLHYPLYPKDSTEAKGTLIMRVRVEWKNLKEASREALLPPPPFHINVKTQKSYDELRYICRGKINLKKANMQNIGKFVDELYTYLPKLYLTLDMMFSTWLWRGRVKVHGKKIWFPVHSIVNFVVALLVVEYPHQVPPIFFGYVAYAMIAMNVRNSKHPNPWRRVKDYTEHLRVILGLPTSQHKGFIPPNKGVEATKRLEKLKELKAGRVRMFLNDSIEVGLEIQKIYNKANVGNHEIETKEKSNFSVAKLFAGDQIKMAHTALMNICLILRQARVFINWRGYYASSFTTSCIVISVILAVTPFPLILKWICRILVLVLMGPLMKLVDIFFVHKRFRTDEELLADPELRPTHLEDILESQWIRKTGNRVRTAAEDALKLKDMRELRFGKYSLRVPPVDIARMESTPTKESKAEPYLGEEGDRRKGFRDLKPQEKDWKYIPGQKLEGVIVQHRCTVSKARNIEEQVQNIVKEKSQHAEESKEEVDGRLKGQ